MPPSRTSNQPARAQRRLRSDPMNAEPIDVRPKPQAALRKRSGIKIHHVLNDLVEVDGLRLGAPYKRSYAGIGDPVLPDPSSRRPPPLLLSDLECVKTLGKGGFGRVVIARSVRNTHPLDKPGSLFAMKILSKKHARLADMDGSFDWKNIERSVLTQLPRNPFIAGLLGTFSDPLNLYLLLELVPNGTLHNIIQNHSPLPASSVQFYFASIVTGLAFLHEHDIVHRDLKPENILIGPGGYLVLTDFGSARRLQDDFVGGPFGPAVRHEWLFVGTTAFLPPEAIPATDVSRQSLYYGIAIDWWSAGCVLFEMITRKMPFYSKNEESMFRRIATCRYKYPPGIRVGRKLRNLVASLLTVDAAKRLGAYGAQEVMNHPWLETIDWMKVARREYRCPSPSHFSEKDDKDLTMTFHTHALPEQRKVPGLRVVQPPAHLAFDKRFPDDPDL